MKRKILTIALITLFTIGAGSIALSYGRGQRGGQGRGQGGYPAGPGPRRAAVEKAESALTEEQKEEMKSLRDSFAEETRPIRNDLELKNLELRHLWTADELDEEAIMAKAGEVSELQSQLHEKMIRHRLDVAKVLPKEYRSRFFAKSHRRNGRGSRGRGRQGRGFGMGSMRGRQGSGPGMRNMRGRQGNGPGMGSMRGHGGGPGFQGPCW